MNQLVPQASRLDKNVPQASRLPESTVPGETPGQPISPTDVPSNYGWHSRGYNPHCDYPGLFQHIGMRLFDSVPAKVIEDWHVELASTSEMERKKLIHDRIDKYADAGYGCCFLAKPEIATIVENALLHFDGKRDVMLAWCVMSNHVHALAVLQVGHTLSEILHTWKSYVAHQANKLLGRTGEFWFIEYYDHHMRSTAELHATIEYIERNPVAANLVSKPEDWIYSSAALRHSERITRNRELYSEVDPTTLPDW